MPNTFPNYKQGSVKGKRLDGRTMTRTTNGKLVGWDLWDTEKMEIPVVLGGLTVADRDIVLAFEAANRTVDFYFTWKEDGVQRLVQFIGKVQVTPRGGGLYDLEFTLGQV